MSNKIMSEVLSGYLNLPTAEHIVIARMIKELEHFSLKDTVCLHVEDNTLNGNDTVKKAGERI